MPIFDHSARRVWLLVATIALTLLVVQAGEPGAASAATPAKTHKKHTKKKTKPKPASNGFDVTVIGSRHYTRSYTGPAPSLASDDLTIDWDWAGTGRATVTRTQFGPSADVNGLAFKLLAYDRRSDVGATWPDFDPTIYPPHWDGKSYIRCEFHRVMQLTGPAGFGGYLSGVRPKDLHPVFRRVVSADLTSDTTGSADPNCPAPPSEDGLLSSQVDLSGRELEARPARANCTASGSLAKGFKRRCMTEIHTVEPNGATSTDVYTLEISLTP